jgi:hypothetical protein
MIAPRGAAESCPVVLLPFALEDQASSPWLRAG